MRVETFEQKLHKLGYPLRGLVKNKGKTNHSCHTHIIAHVADGCVEENSYRLVRSGTTIRERKCILCTITEDGVSVCPHFLDNSISILFLSVIYKCYAHCDTTDNFFMLRLTSIIFELCHNLKKFLCVARRDR